MPQPIQPGDRVVTPTGHHYYVETESVQQPGWWCCRPIWGGPPVLVDSRELGVIHPDAVADPMVYICWTRLVAMLQRERERWTHDRGATEAVDDCLDLLRQMQECISDISPTVEEP